MPPLKRSFTAKNGHAHAKVKRSIALMVGAQGMWCCEMSYDMIFMLCVKLGGAKATIENDRR